MHFCGCCCEIQATLIAQNLKSMTTKIIQGPQRLASHWHWHTVLYVNPTLSAGSTETQYDNEPARLSRRNYCTPRTAAPSAMSSGTLGVMPVVDPTSWSSACHSANVSVWLHCCVKFAPTSASSVLLAVR